MHRQFTKKKCKQLVDMKDSLTSNQTQHACNTKGGASFNLLEGQTFYNLYDSQIMLKV